MELTPGILSARRTGAVAGHADVQDVAARIGLDLDDGKHSIYLTDKPSDDPAETCWLINQYDFDAPMQWICAQDVSLDDHNDAKHSEDSY